MGTDNGVLAIAGCTLFHGPWRCGATPSGREDLNHYNGDHALWCTLMHINEERTQKGQVEKNKY